MGIFSSIKEFGSECSEPICLALGMFDGVHIGHRQVLDAAINQSNESEGSAVAFTFPEHPARFLRPEQAPPLLMNPEQKALSLQAYGMKEVIMQSFDAELAEIPFTVFPDFLKRRIPSLSGVCVGQNFRFGKGRAGDSSLLREIAVKAGLKVNIVESINCDSLPVSSSRIREALSLGNIEQVNQMLGRDYSIFGIVSSGKGMGRKIGFPTLNLDWDPEAKPAYGVYAGEVKNIKTGIILPAVANYGLRPTLESNVLVPKFEINILADLNENGWECGSELDMSLKFFLRPEKKFQSVEKLSEQIHLDRGQAIKLVNQK